MLCRHAQNSAIELYFRINERGEWTESFPSPRVGRVNTIILSGVHNVRF